LGIHILHPSETEDAVKLLDTNDHNDQWHYVTIPLTLDDLKNKGEWDSFCQYAKDHKIIPIVRLMTRFDNGAWQIPTRKNIMDMVSFMSSLDWPTDEHYVIVFNEVNHAQEWGNSIDPQGYSDILQFTSDWAKSEPKNYKILPAAMDLAAPNSGNTKEAFAYLDSMYQYNSRIFDYVDYWNSHSYPNPGFSAAPTATGKGSLRGFLTELDYIKNKTGHEYRTFITETGWAANAQTTRNLDSYYTYAAHQIWSDPRVVAVTPFVLRGDPGIFSAFTFINRNGQPTRQYQAYQKVIGELAEKH
jgi:hypothetical protein